MTDEQICELAKDKALDIQKYIIDGNVDIDSFAKDCCLAGAHSRDEEVTSLLSQLEDKDGYIAHLREELNKLSNPWISVEERLPEVRDGYKGFSKNVLVLYRDQETGMSYITEAYYDFEYKGDGGWVLANGDDEHFFYSDYQENGYIVTHWMCIPKLKKGE